MFWGSEPSCLQCMLLIFKDEDIKNVKLIKEVLLRMVC